MNFVIFVNRKCLKAISSVKTKIFKTKGIQETHVRKTNPIIKSITRAMSVSQKLQLLEFDSIA